MQALMAKSATKPIMTLFLTIIQSTFEQL